MVEAMVTCPSFVDVGKCRNESVNKALAKSSLLINPYAHM